MEKICEFCTTSRPVVYCKADAAHLCLSCDAKVHSANALSNRHLRTLLCDLCRYRPSYIRCLDHRMFMCCGCDQSLHDSSSQHQRRAVSSYLGCPSANDFAALWGFELHELDCNAIEDHPLSASRGSMNSNVIELDDPGQSCLQNGGSSTKSKVTSSLSAGFDIGSSSKIKAVCKGQQQQNASFILQQILDLNKLQLTEGESLPPTICGQEKIDTSASICDPLNNLDGNLGQNAQDFQDIGNSLNQSDIPLQDLEVDALPLSFTQLENLSSSSIPSGQLWSQNMQDLGVCEDIFCRDDFNMPDVDITFRNFDELFGGDQDPIRAVLDNKFVSCSSVEKDVSLHKSDNCHARALENVSVASSLYITPSTNIKKDGNPSDEIRSFRQNIDSAPRPIRPSYSTMSFAISRFSTESTRNDCLDSGLSPTTGVEASCNSPDLDTIHSEARENAVMRYKEKKKARLLERQIRSASHNARSAEV